MRAGCSATWWAKLSRAPTAPQFQTPVQQESQHQGDPVRQDDAGDPPEDCIELLLDPLDSMLDAIEPLLHAVEAFSMLVGAFGPGYPDIECIGWHGSCLQR
jgi:hypothetical protein